MESAYFTRLEKLVFKRLFLGGCIFLQKGFYGFVIILKL